MIIRNCAGGVVFSGTKVFLLRNDKSEWVLPKGVIREKRRAAEVALERVRIEAGVQAEILHTAGDTSYEFYSQTRRSPVCNRIAWFVMRALSEDYRSAFEQGFIDGDWYPVEQALEMITYSQDRSIVRIAYDIYKTIVESQRSVAGEPTAGTQA